MRLLKLPTLLAVACALGCQTGGEETTSPTAGKAQGEPTQTSIEKPTAGDSSPGGEGTTEPTPEGKGPKLTAEDNPSRLYQLRDLAKATIKVNGQPVPVWLMTDNGKRQEGMMFLKEKDVKPTEGMLFVFPDEQGPDHGFWMHNTHLPLDIVYISKAGAVVNAVAGKPFDETNLPAGATFQYVLEMRQGGAKRLGIKKGTPVEIPNSVLEGVS